MQRKPFSIAVYSAQLLLSSEVLSSIFINHEKRSRKIDSMRLNKLETLSLSHFHSYPRLLKALTMTYSMPFMISRLVNGVDDMKIFDWWFNRKHYKDLEARKIHDDNIKKIKGASVKLKEVEESRSSIHESIAEKIYGAMGGGSKR